MKKSPQTSTKKRYLIFGIVGFIAILLGLGGLKLYDNLQTKSYLLGDKLEYIGGKIMDLHG